MADKFRSIQELAAELTRRLEAKSLDEAELAAELEQRIDTQLELNRALLDELSRLANSTARATHTAVQVERQFAGIQCPNGHITDRSTNFCGQCGANMRAVK